MYSTAWLQMPMIIKLSKVVLALKRMVTTPAAATNGTGVFFQMFSISIGLVPYGVQIAS